MSLEVGSIRRIQGIGYGVLEFLRVGTTFDIFQNIHILYFQYGVLVFWIRRIDLLSVVVFDQVNLTKEIFSSMLSMKDMGEADVIFGIRIKHGSNRIAISQSQYIEKISKKQTCITGSIMESEFVAVATCWHSMVRELFTNGVVSIEYVRSQQNLADHLTKGLARYLVANSDEGMGLNSNQVVEY
ncbi:hypothetical protein Tco_0016834 [Tanacetum coccineum]